MANLVRLAVPSNKYVEKIYLNNTLSDIEVINILNQLDFTTYPAYLVYCDSSSAETATKFIYITADKDIYVNNTKVFEGESDLSDYGWQTNIEICYSVNSDNFSEEITTFNGINVGHGNDKLSNLFSITPYSYENNTEFLSDMGNAIRSKLDTTSSLKGKDMPNWVRSITTNKALEVSTSEEMDALLVAENVGKIYKYIGETNDKYTYGKLYTIEEV